MEPTHIVVVARKISYASSITLGSTVCGLSQRPFVLTRLRPSSRVEPRALEATTVTTTGALAAGTVGYLRGSSGAPPAFGNPLRRARHGLPAAALAISGQLGGLHRGSLPLDTALLSHLPRERPPAPFSCTGGVPPALQRAKPASSTGQPPGRHGLSRKPRPSDAAIFVSYLCTPPLCAAPWTASNNPQPTPWRRRDGSQRAAAAACLPVPPRRRGGNSARE